MLAEAEAAEGFAFVEFVFVGKVELGWPLGGVSVPVECQRGDASVECFGDEGCSGEVAG